MASGWAREILPRFQDSGQHTDGLPDRSGGTSVTSWYGRPQTPVAFQHTRQKAHPLLPRVLDQHKLMYVKRRTWQPLTRDMIDIMIYLDQHTSSVGTSG
jgi:hypothetical protein